MKNKTILVTGATGFLGSIACDYFIKENWNVIKAGRNDKKVDVWFNLDDPKGLSRMRLSTPVDVLLHVAAAHEVTCYKEPYESVARNVIGTKATLDFCIYNGIKKIIYLSTFHVFGNLFGKIDENRIPIPSNDYGLTHLQAEEYVKLYGRKNKIEWIIIRPTNLFDMPIRIDDFNRWTLTPYAFCRDGMLNGKIKLNTPGKQIRNFVSAREVCQVINCAIEKKIKNKILHVYGPDSLSILELAILVKESIFQLYHDDIILDVPMGDNKEKVYNFSSRYLDLIGRPKFFIKPFLLSLIRKIKGEI